MVFYSLCPLVYHTVVIGESYKSIEEGQFFMILSMAEDDTTFPSPWDN